MRYEIVFSLPQVYSGEATYIAKQFITCCYPYQFERPNNYRAQQFIFKDLASLNRFIKIMSERFDNKFIIESIVNLSYKKELRKDGK